MMDNDDLNRPLLPTNNENDGGSWTQAANTSSTTSYYGKVSPLSTGMLFPSPRGIVDALPHPTKPCLLFADHDPLSAVAHICLLEKEFASSTDNIFTIVHVCESLAKHDDAGMRILKKINVRASALPVLLHDGNIFQEGGRGSDINWWTSSLACLLPKYIDGAVGQKNLLTPDDAIGLYNMNLFIERHSELPGLFHMLLINPSLSQRTQLSKELLQLLKRINSDLQKFDGPYLCGKQFTLADIIIYPLIERIVLVLPTYRSFWIPPSLTHLISWYEHATNRPSIRAATSDRSVESQNTYCYERVRRDEYLIEVYECCARHEGKLFKELNDARGRPGVNVYRQEVEEERTERGICERNKLCHHHCIIS